MSYGIPGLYIASANSELARYCDKYEHAQCFEAQELQQAAEYISELAMDTMRHREMQGRAEQAATQFRRSNADAFVNRYLEKQESSQ